MQLKTSGILFICLFLGALHIPLLSIGIVNVEASNNEDFTYSKAYTDSSFKIHSASTVGNFSFAFEWQNSDTYIEYDGTRRVIRELKLVRFTDETAGYALEYWIPRMLYEYKTQTTTASSQVPQTRNGLSLDPTHT